MTVVLRYFLLFTITIIEVLFSSGCNASTISKTSTNSIAHAELTDREQAILTTTSEYSFIFDYKVDNTYKEVTVWLEKYQDGELIDERVNQLTTLIEEGQESGIVIFAASKNMESNSTLSFQIGIESGGAVGSVRGGEPATAKKPKTLDSMSAANSEKIDITEGEFVLASIFFADSENGMSTLPTDFYENAGGNLNALKAYDVVYLVKGEFLDQDHSTLNNRRIE